MPDSQMHRPGVKVQESPNKRLAKTLAEAAELEKQLDILKKSKNEDKSARLRRSLCEALSDALITDPKVSRDQDCCTRLWNGCFYGVVSHLRKRIASEKKKKGPNLKSLNGRYKAFLKDAVTLYDYLLAQYHEKLLPDSSQMEDSQESTQESTFDIPGTASFEGVIENLFKLYIHAGDLHRYDENYKKAESFYLNAVKLAPGKGNPYNQLAVVAQMKDANMSCVALYWYTRSLMATHQSFETSSSNLDRLFNGNSNYLKNFSRDNLPPILDLENKKKMAQDKDLIRERKASASKSCLAHFVDVHDRIYKLAKESSDESKEFELAAKMKAVSRSLESIFRYSAFSESLLCKMVTINTFTCEVNKSELHSASYRLAREFIFVVGSSFSTPLGNVLSKILENDKNNNPTVRLLLPFEILCEFILNLDDHKGREEDTFWKEFVGIANLALKVSQKLGITANSFELEDDVSVPLKEYQLLQGYRPFQFLFPNYISESPFIDAEAAIDVLELTCSQSQESTSNNSEENSTKLARFLEICNKCASKKSIPVRHDAEKGYVFSHNVVEELETPKSKSVAQDLEDTVSPMRVESSPLDSGFDNVDMMQSPEDEDDAGDVVVYKAPETGGGPALLVPGALLAKTSTTSPEISTPESSKKPNKNGASSSERTQLPSIPQPHAPAVEATQPMPVAAAAESPSLPPPPGLLPPPGFTAPMATTQQSPSPMRSPAVTAQAIPAPMHGIPSHQTVYGQVMQANMYAGVSNPLSYGALPPGSVPVQGIPAAQPTGGALPFGQSWNLFGGPETLQTANPFAGPSPVGYGNAKPANTLFDEHPITADGTSLLDSALIDSLFMNDAKTKNPWND